LKSAGLRSGLPAVCFLQPGAPAKRRARRADLFPAACICGISILVCGRFFDRHSHGLYRHRRSHFRRPD
jgi:hypothetical protein